MSKGWYSVASSVQSTSHNEHQLHPLSFSFSLPRTSLKSNLHPSIRAILVSVVDADTCPHEQPFESHNH